MALIQARFEEVAFIVVYLSASYPEWSEDAKSSHYL